MNQNKYTDITFYGSNAIYWEDYEHEKQSRVAQEFNDLKWMRIS